MEWLNVHVSVLDSAEFLGSDPTERGTWLCLMRYCIGQENDGVIEDAATWKDRQWQQVCGVTLREVKGDHRLWRWDGEHLTIFGYPHEKQTEVQAKRAAGVATAKKRWSRKLDSSATSSADSLSQKEHDAEGKGREGNGKQGKGSYPRAHSLVPSELPHFHANELAQQYNTECAEPYGLTLTTFPLAGARLDNARERLREHPDPDWWLALWHKVGAATYLRRQPWATFDWFVKDPTNAAKVLEGQFVTETAKSNGNMVSEAEEAAVRARWAAEDAAGRENDRRRHASGKR